MLNQDPQQKQHPEPLTLVDWDLVPKYLSLAGKGGDKGTVFAVFPPTDDQGCIFIGMKPDGSFPKEEVEKQLRKRPAHGLGVVVNKALPVSDDWGTKRDHYDKKTGHFLRQWGASGAHIWWGKTLFAEGDAGLPIEEQLQAPQKAGLPTPTMVVVTTSRSVHFYWKLDTALTPEEWQRAMVRLLCALEGAMPENGWDSSLTSLCRVMRIPGSLHPKTGKRVHILEGVGTGEMHEWEVIDSLLPPLPTYGKQPSRFLGNGEFKPGTQAPGWFSRMSEKDQLIEAIKMLEVIPSRGEAGTGTRAPAVKILAALVHHFGTEFAVEICHQAGWFNEHWNPEDEASRIGGHINPAGMGWVIQQARAHGWRHPHEEMQLRILKNFRRQALT